MQDKDASSRQNGACLLVIGLLVLLLILTLGLFDYISSRSLLPNVVFRLAQVTKSSAS